MASVWSVTIQAKSGLKDTIISDNEETLEGFVQNGGKCLTIEVQLGRGDLLRDGIIVWNRG